MKRYLQILFALSVVLSGCKSNPEAYNATYKKLKEQERINSETKADARTPMDVPKDFMSGDSVTHVSEAFTLIVGQEKNISAFNIVAKSFINQTNAKDYHLRLVKEGYPAVLVQNRMSIFRIIVASCVSEDEAIKKLDAFKKTFPKAWILKKQ